MNTSEESLVYSRRRYQSNSPAPSDYLSILGLLCNYYNEIDHTAPDIRFFIPSIYVNLSVRINQCNELYRSRTFVGPRTPEYIPYIFNCITEGKSISTIQIQLSHESVELTKVQIMDILTDSKLCGVLPLNGYSATGIIFNKVIPVSLYNDVQKRLVGNLFDVDVNFSLHIDNVVSKLNEPSIKRIASACHKKLINVIYSLIHFFRDEYARLNDMKKDQHYPEYERQLLYDCLDQCGKYFNVLRKLTYQPTFCRLILGIIGEQQWFQMNYHERTLYEQLIFPEMSWNEDRSDFRITNQLFFLNEMVI